MFRNALAGQGTGHVKPFLFQITAGHTAELNKNVEYILFSWRVQKVTVASAAARPCTAGPTAASAAQNVAQ